MRLQFKSILVERQFGKASRSTMWQAAQNELWVFGYGSLMWNPGFDFVERFPAELTGYHRAFCVYSVFYRGTPARPGLVLGLDRGGSCQGVAFRVAPGSAAETLRYLRAREQITGVYREIRVPVALFQTSSESGQRRAATAVTFVVERNHPGYASTLPLARQAHLIRSAKGRAGCNLAYALNTISHMQNMNCIDRSLARLMPVLGSVFAGVPAGSGQCDASLAVREAACRALPQYLRYQKVAGRRVRPDQRKRFIHRDHLASRSDHRYEKTR